MAPPTATDSPSSVLVGADTSAKVAPSPSAISEMDEAGLVKAAKLSLQPRRWHERGHADHGWLKTFHTFSFAMYYDDRFMDFSNLRVINEDRVAPSTGFGTHPHREAEIFSYIVSGELEHRDSMGNVEILKRGEVQFTSAGTGIRHSEYNRNSKVPVHFLQIWYTPDVRGLKPLYYTSVTPDSAKQDQLATLIRPISTLSSEEQKVTGLLPPLRAIPSHSSLATFASILSAGKSVRHPFGKDTDAADKAGTERWVYAHLIQTSGYKNPDTQAGQPGAKGEARIKLNGGLELEEGDGVFVRGGKVGEYIEFENIGKKEAEFLVFDVRP